MVNDVDATEAETVVDEITAAGGTAAANTDDVSTWAGAEAAVDQRRVRAPAASTSW